MLSALRAEFRGKYLEQIIYIHKIGHVSNFAALNSFEILPLGYCQYQGRWRPGDTRNQYEFWSLFVPSSCIITLPGKKQVSMHCIMKSVTNPAWPNHWKAKFNRYICSTALSMLYECTRTEAPALIYFSKYIKIRPILVLIKLCAYY